MRTKWPSAKGKKETGIAPASVGYRLIFQRRILVAMLGVERFLLGRMLTEQRIRLNVVGAHLKTMDMQAGVAPVNFDHPSGSRIAWSVIFAHAV